MVIHWLRQDGAFDDVAVKVLTDAYDAALRELGVVNRANPLTRALATKIIEIARTGERDPRTLCELAIREL